MVSLFFKKSLKETIVLWRGIILFFFFIGLLLFRYIKNKTVSKNIYRKLWSLYFSMIILLIMAFGIQLVTIIHIEAQYRNMVKEYHETFISNVQHGDSDSKDSVVRAAWNIATDYKNKFFGTYGREDILVPSRNTRRLVNRLNGYNLPGLLILRLYFSLGDNFNKLIAVERTGGCGEFARATARILYDATGLPTRVIMMEGIDHTFPEVYIDGKWMVFDIIYTTPRQPVLASEYAHYLSKGEKRLDKYIARLMVETEKRRSYSMLQMSMVLMFSRWC